MALLETQGVGGQCSAAYIPGVTALQVPWPPTRTILFRFAYRIDIYFLRDMQTGQRVRFSKTTKNVKEYARFS